MKILKRAKAILMTAVMMVTFTACGSKQDNARKLDIEKNVTINIWYDDAAYSPYIEYVAQQLSAANELLTVNPVFTDTDNYLDNVYKAAIGKADEQPSPDVYLINSDDLQKIYLTGIMAENDTYSSKYTTGLYGNAVINACTYDGKLYGYPLSFNTGIMVYNKKYVTQPDTFTNIAEYSNSYKVDDNNKDVQLITAWDSTDMFLNYGFAAPYLNIGGTSSDDKNIADVDDSKLKEAMTGYAQLKNDYALYTTTDENYCIDKFKNGNLIYTIIRSERLSELDDTDIDYGVCNIPDINSNLKSAAISTTDMAVVNPYSDNQEAAKTVAHALSYDYAVDMYKYCKKPSVRNDCEFIKNADNYKALYSVYSDSVVKAQFVGADEIYLRYELMIKKIWLGTPVNDAVTEFENMIKQRH